MSVCVLKTENLSIGYGSRCVAEGISLQLEEGRILCLIGPNGSGKSTLLKTLMRQIPPLKGAIFLGDRKLDRIPEQELARCSAAVLTGRPTPELMTCGELVAMGRYPYTGRLGILSEEDRAVVRSSMEMTETAFLRDEDFTRISDGQRQRVLLARAICQQPKLLLLDEPTSFLDIRHKLEFLLLLRKLAETQNIAVVLSLHELDLAKIIPDRILCLKNGHVDREGPPGEIFRDDYIRRLFDVEEKTYAAVYGEAGAPF